MTPAEKNLHEIVNGFGDEQMPVPAPEEKAKCWQCNYCGEKFSAGWVHNCSLRELRDQFAMAALNVAFDILTQSKLRPTDADSWNEKHLVMEAYGIADAMLLQRAKK